MKLGIRIFLYAIATPFLLWGQDFDQLTIRPLFDDGTEAYLSGKLSWAEADGWPTLDPETVSLRAPESGVTPYTMTMAAEKPPAKYCLMMDSTGQWSFVRCRNATFAAKVGQVTLLDETTDNDACVRDRVTASAGTTPRPHWIRMACSNQEHFTVKFQVPPGIPDEPELQFWAYSSTGFGSPDYEVRRHCSTPDDGDVWADAWDATYTPSHTFGASGRLSLVKFAQTSWFPVEGDLCVFDIEQTTSGSITSFLVGQVK